MVDYFKLGLTGNAEDDAKLKKCVSTRYATVLILLTVKCKYYLLICCNANNLRMLKMLGHQGLSCHPNDT